MTDTLSYPVSPFLQDQRHNQNAPGLILLFSTF